MKNRPERILSSLAIIISFLVAFCPAYLQYDSLIEIDFLSPVPGFENPDSDNLLSDEQSKTKIFVSGFSPAISHLGVCGVGQPPQLSPPIFHPDPPIGVLRC